MCLLLCGFIFSQKDYCFMVLITLGALYFIFILRLVFYSGLTVEAIYNTTYFWMKKEYYPYKFTELEHSTLTYTLPIIILAEHSKWGGHGRKTDRSAIYPPPDYRIVSRNIQSQAASRSTCQISRTEFLNFWSGEYTGICIVIMTNTQ